MSLTEVREELNKSNNIMAKIRYVWNIMSIRIDSGMMDYSAEIVL